MQGGLGIHGCFKAGKGAGKKEREERGLGFCVRARSCIRVDVMVRLQKNCKLLRYSRVVQGLD